MFMRFLSVLACTAAVATAQLQLTTTFANNNGGAAGGAVYFDLDAVGLVTITDLACNFSSVAGTQGTLDVYVIPGGSHVGNETNAAAWQLFGSSNPITAAGPGQPTPVTFPGGSLPPIGPGPGGCCFVANGLANTYTNGAAPVTTFSGVNLTLNAGSASNVPFTGGIFQPRIVNVTINYSPGSGTPATNTTLGQGCYESFASFYESFAAGTNDLSNTCGTLTPQAGGGYVVTPTGPGYSGPGPNLVPLPLTDDSQIDTATVGGTLGLFVGSNGWSALGGGNSNAFTPTTAIVLNNPSTAVYAFHDMNPAAAGSGQVFYEEPTPTTAIVTYNGVFNFAGTGPADANFIQFRWDFGTTPPTIECDFGQLSANGNNWIIGYSPGGPSNDPGSIDLSATAQVVLTANDVNPLTLTATSRPVTGTNWNLAVSNNTGVIPVVIVGVTDPNIPDLSLVGLNVPGCGLRASLDVINVGATFSLPIPGNATLIGSSLYANGADLLNPNGNFLGLTTSNGIQGTIGDI